MAPARLRLGPPVAMMALAAGLIRFALCSPCSLRGDRGEGAVRRLRRHALVRLGPVAALIAAGRVRPMSAERTVMENGGKIVLLDKSSFCGGNFTKATCGINNGAATRTQKASSNNVELFISGNLTGGAKTADVVKVLCGNSGARTWAARAHRHHILLLRDERVCGPTVMVNSGMTMQL